MAKLVQQTGTHKTTSGKSRKLEIDPEGYDLIMSFLTRAYTDPAEATGREYTTNGIDANKLTGKGPVRVTLPTRWNAEFVVEDDGPGMSEQELDDVFRKYTASSKRDTNDQTGMFGIGSKAALAYADMFTLVSIHDGRKVAITVSRNETGGGVMDEMVAEDVDADSGVVIRVPVHDVDAFNHSVKKYFSEVPPGLVVVRNGTDGEYEDPSLMEKVIDGIWVKRREGDVSRLVSGSPKMMMGNVTYPVSDEHRLHHTSYRVFFEVDLGEYQPLPSREAIEWNNASIKKFKQVMVDRYTDLIDAFKKDPGLYYKYHYILGSDYYVQRFFPSGHKYSNFDANNIFKDMRVQGVDYVFNEEEKQLSSIKDLNRGVVVVCPTKDDIPKRAKRRRLATVFADTPTGTMSNWVVKSKLTDQIDKTFTLQEVEHKAKKANGGTSKRVPNWDVIDAQYWQWSEKIPYDISRAVPMNTDLGDQQIVFLTRDDVVKEYHPHNRQVEPRMQLMRKCMDLAAKDDDVLLVRRQANHVEATRRDFPEAMSLWEWFLDTLHSSRTENYVGCTLSRYGRSTSISTLSKQEIIGLHEKGEAKFFQISADDDAFNFASVEKKMQSLSVGQDENDDTSYWTIFTHEQLVSTNGTEVFGDIDKFLKKRSDQYKETVETAILFKTFEHLSSSWYFDLEFLKESDVIRPHYEKLDLPHDSRYSSTVHTRLSNVWDQVHTIIVPEGTGTRNVNNRYQDLFAELANIVPFAFYVNTQALSRTQQRNSLWYISHALRNLHDSQNNFNVKDHGAAASEEFVGFLEEKKDEIIKCIESHLEKWEPLNKVSN